MPSFISDDEMDELEKSGGSFISDDQMLELEKSADDYARQGAGMIERGAQSVGQGISNVAEKIDQYNPFGASLRAGIAAKQDGESFAAAYGNQFLREPKDAPTAKDLLGKAGVSTKEFDTGLVKNPFTGEEYKASPAGIGGAAVMAATDPTTYIPGRAVAKGLEMGARGVSKMAPEVAAYMARVAEERAVKAGTGQSIRAMRKIAKVSPQGGADMSRAADNLQRAGRQMLEPDEAGKSIVGWTDNARGIGEKAATKRGFYGNQIGEVGKTVDKLNPQGAIIGEDLAKELRTYAESIPNVGQGAQIRQRVLAEADNVSALGPMSFEQAQKVKNQFPFKPQAADALISSQDATNRVRGVVSSGMNESVEKTAARNALPEDIGPQLPQPSADDAAKLSKYGEAKDRYGLYKDIESAGQDRSLKDLSNRFVSPSSYGAGAGVGVATAAAKGDLSQAGLMGLAATAINKIVIERGSAFAARSADAISKQLLKAPDRMRKWMPILQQAAKRGNEALVVTHHTMMENDSDYRQAMTEAEAP